MSDKKQSSVEWLVEKIQQANPSFKFDALIRQAKTMEKEQIINACNQEEFEDIDGYGIHETISKGEQYYNETYGGE